LKFNLQTQKTIKIMVTKASTSFLSRVMSKLTGGDEGKIARFQAKAVKLCKAQSTLRTNEIEDLNEKVNDLNEKYEDTLTSVDLAAIATSDNLDTYLQSYLRKVTGVTNEIEAVKAEIAVKEAEKAKFDKIVADLA
jgi:hypothetical protein